LPLAPARRRTRGSVGLRVAGGLGQDATRHGLQTRSSVLAS
jgi:hypothetical protein